MKKPPFRRLFSFEAKRLFAIAQLKAEPRSARLRSPNLIETNELVGDAVFDQLFVQLFD